MKKLTLIIMTAALFIAASCEKQETALSNEPFKLKATTTSATIQRGAGWGMFSTNIEMQNMNAADFFSQYPEIHFAKTADGRVYWDLGNAVINTIGNINCLEGYMIHVLEPVTIVMEGELTGATMPAEMPVGWSMWGCPYQFPIYPTEAYPMPQPANTFDVIKESVGDGVFWENYGINQLGMLAPYDSYMVHIDDGLNWTSEDLREYNGLQSLQIKETKDGNTCGICDESTYYNYNGDKCSKNEAFVMINSNGVFVL